jgi:hypothetical protein
VVEDHVRVVEAPQPSEADGGGVGDDAHFDKSLDDIGEDLLERTWLAVGELDVQTAGTARRHVRREARVGADPVERQPRLRDVDPVEVTPEGAVHGDIQVRQARATELPERLGDGGRQFVK